MSRKPQDSHHTRTSPVIEQASAPRLPHERDESGDSQTGTPQGVIRQAKEDLDRGLVDTDRGAPMDRTYHHSVKGGTQPSGTGSPKRQG